MPNLLTILFIAHQILFLATGVIILLFGMIIQNEQSPSQVEVANVAQIVLSRVSPPKASFANAVLVFLTFLVGVPSFFSSTSTRWLRIQGWMVVVCAIFTLVIGLTIWFTTLGTRTFLSSIWQRLPMQAQGLLEQRFNCCGYLDPSSPPFVKNPTCPSSEVAAMKGGCIVPFSDFTNSYLDIIFTSAFGIVALDAIFIVFIAMVIGRRKEQKRFRYIDEKSGFSKI